MIPALTNHLWQSTLFALAAGLLAFALRRNGAHVRHWLWVTASIKFIVPFSLLMSLGSWFAGPTAHSTVSATAAPNFSIAIDQIAQPFSGGFMAGLSVSESAGLWTMPMALLIIWAVGFLGIALIRWQGWQRVRTAMRASTKLSLASVDTMFPRLQARSSPGTLEPGVVGWWRPVLLVPAGIEAHLTPEQLRAVLAHEQCHVRRRDNLTAALHMVIEAVFWFHPLVWWIGARMVDERERACDEYVLRVCGEPRVYAEGIIKVCKLYVESPLTCVSGVTGLTSPKHVFGGGALHLKRRIEAIMLNHIGVDLNSARKATLVVAAVFALALPLAVGTITAPLRAFGGNQEASAKAAQFEVASIKPCEPGQPATPGARGGGAALKSSPGRVHIECFRLALLVDTAYIKRNRGAAVEGWPFMGGSRYNGSDPGPLKVRGGPSWVYSQQWTIEAKAATAADEDTMMGPMLRALLEDRFQLKLHTETEDVAIWALTVAKSGLKIKPMKEGDCDPDRSAGGVAESTKPRLGTVNGGPNGPNWRWEHCGQDLDTIAGMVSWDLGDAVLNRTGVTGKFKLMWEYGPDENTPGALQNMQRSAPGAATPTAPNIFTALEEQLGLKLEKIKGSRGYIVIDRVERPTLNLATPARATGPGGR